VGRGAYHFLSSAAVDTPELQAERFVAYVNLHGGFVKGDMAPAVDLEWDIARPGGPDQWKNRTVQEIVATALAFLTRVEALTGKTPMLYTSRAWWRERQIPETEIVKFSRYAIWIADFSDATLSNEKPLAPNNQIPTLWQFTDKAKISVGPSAYIDADVFRGTENDFLRTFFGAR
jgi:lysozyme